MDLTHIEYIDSKLFRRKDAEKVFGGPLPKMPAAPVGEPWEWKRASVTYVMERAEEKQRFLEWNYAKKRLSGYVRKKLPTAMITYWRQRAEHLEEYLIRLNLPLVYSLLCRFRWRFSNLEWDDGVSVGQGGLMRAMLRFQPELGWKFSSYACRAILNCFRQSNAKTTRRKTRLNGSDSIDTYEEELVVDENTTPEAVEQLNRVMLNNEAGLNADELLVIWHRFELGNCKEKETLEQIGDRLGVSKERVRQIQNKALSKLREVMA